nr:PAS domain S-box protein [Methanolinea mesophila]
MLPDLKKYRADLVRNAVLVIAYVVFARLSLFFSIGEGNISTIWLPTGIAAAAVLLFGPRILPGVWLGEVIGNLYTGLSPTILVFYGLGNVAEAWIFYTVVQRISGSGPFYCRLSGVAGFALGTGVACTAAAVTGVSTLYAFGAILPGEYAANAAIWWVGDVMGILVATPLIISWSRPSALKFPTRYLTEYALFYVALVFTAYFIFSTGFSPAITRGMPYVVLIFIVWAVFRLGERHVTAASALAGVFAVRAVITGTGPFSGQTLAIQLFTTEGFIAITSMTGIILIAVVAERRVVDAQLRKSREDLEKRVQERTEALSNDIARREIAEQALKQSERRLSDIIDFIPDAVLVVDRQGVVITWNRAMEELTGVGADEMIGKGNQEYAIPFYGKRRPILIDMVLDPGPGVTEMYPGVIRKDREILIAEVTISRPDGRKQVLWGKASPVYDDEGKIAGAIESIRDVTERKETEEALQESHSLLEDALDQAHMAYWEADPQKGVFTFNDRFYALHGTSAEREGGYTMPTGTYIHEFLYPEDAGIIGREVEKALHTKDPGFISESEHRILRRDGVIRYVTVRVRITKDDGGRTIKAFGVTQDITERAEAEAALKKSNFFLEEAMDQAHMADWEFDVPSGIFTFNDRFYALYGTSAEREGGYTMSAEVYAREFVHPDDSGVVAHEVEKAITATDPDYVSEVEHRIIRRDGEIRFIVVRIRITKDAEGKTVKTHGANQDITPRKRAEIALSEAKKTAEESLALYTTLFENSPIGFGFVDTDFRVIITNSALAGFSPVPRNEQTGKMLVELIPDYWPALGPIFTQVLSNGVPVTGIDVPGEDVPRSVMAQRFLANLYPIRIRGGRTIGIGVIVVDVTRLKAVEETIRRSRDYYLKLFDDFPNPVWRSDLSGTFDYFNREWLSFTGRSLEQEYHDGWKDGVHPDDRAAVEETYRRSFQAKKTFEMEFRLKSHDGTYHWILASGKPFYDLEGNFSGYLGACYDIQDRKRTELALQVVNRKLNLLSSITRHDIINQVTALKGYLELSHEVPMVPELAEFIRKEEQVTEAIERQILFTRDYQDMGVTSPVWQDVRTTIVGAMSGLPMRDCDVKVEFTGLEVYADPLLEKVFFNLIDNALRYGGSKMTNIRFSARRSGDTEVIVCEDDGEGITAEDKLHLFERGHGKHTGLGLFLSREILAITGITILETSGIGTGARFEITVPDGAFRWAEGENG